MTWAVQHTHNKEASKAHYQFSIHYKIQYSTHFFSIAEIKWVSLKKNPHIHWPPYTKTFTLIMKSIRDQSFTEKVYQCAKINIFQSTMT